MLAVAANREPSDTDTVPAVRLDRRWVIAIVLAIGVAGALALSQTWLKRPSEECRPVIDLLDFNTSQAALISAKSDDEQSTVPSAAEETAYVAWADGLAERAGKVTSPQLAAQAVELASLANQFVARLPVLRAATEARAPGAPAPPVTYEMSALNDRITNDIAELTKACRR